MKKTLLTLLSLISLSGFAQTVNSFYAYDATSVDQSSYTIGTGTWDESAAGANVAWDFSGVTSAGTALSWVTAPTTAQTTTYPGTGYVATSTGEYNGAGTSSTIDIFTTEGGAITGISLDNIILNYSTNNATLGTFPLQYGYTNTDQVAGTYSATLSGTVYNGTFTGTCVSSIDAYGTATSSIGSIGGTLTRLKIVQNLTLYYLGFNAGTATQTTYMYYTTGTSMPRIRSLTTNINIPALSVNDGIQSIEFYEATIIGATSAVTKNSIGITPNPTTDILHFTGGLNMTKVTIVDTAGRIVLTGTGNDLNVSSLNTGIYYATAETDNGRQTIKFIKK